MRLFRVVLLLLERPDAQHFGCWSWRVEHRDPGRGGKLKSFLQSRRPRPLLLHQKSAGAEANEPRPSHGGTRLSTSSFASSKSAGGSAQVAAQHATRQPATLAAPDVNFADDFCLTEDDFICEQVDQEPTDAESSRTRAAQRWESPARPNVITISGRSHAEDVSALTRDELALSYSGDRVTLTRHGNIEAENKNKVSVGCRTKAAFNFVNVDAVLGPAGEKSLNEQLADKQRVITATLKGEKTERTFHWMERQGVRSKNPGMVFELDTSQVGERLDVQAFVMVPQKREDMKDGNCRLEMTKGDNENEKEQFPRCYSVMLYESNQLDHFKAGVTMLRHLATGVNTEYASQLQGDPQDGHAGNEMVEFHMHTDGGFVVKLNRMEIGGGDAAASGGGGSSSSLLQRTSATRADDGGQAAKFNSARTETERERRRGAVPLLVRRGKEVEIQPKPRTPQAALAPTTASSSSRGESISTDVNNDGGAIATGVPSPTSFLQRRGMARHGYQEHVRAAASSKDPVLVVWCGGDWYHTCFTRADHWNEGDLLAVANYKDDAKQIQKLKLVQASSREGYTSKDVNAFRKQKYAAEALGSAVRDKGMVLFVTLQTFWVEKTRSFDENGLPSDNWKTDAEMQMPQEQIGDLGKAKLKFGAVRISKHAKVTQVTEDAVGYKGPKTCAEVWKARGGVMNRTGPPAGEERQPEAPPAERVPADGSAWEEDAGGDEVAEAARRRRAVAAGRRPGRHFAEGDGEGPSSQVLPGAPSAPDVTNGRREQKRDHDHDGHILLWIVAASAGGAAAVVALCALAIYCCRGGGNFGAYDHHDKNANVVGLSYGKEGGPDDRVFGSAAPPPAVEGTETPFHTQAQLDAMRDHDNAIVASPGQHQYEYVNVGATATIEPKRDQEGIPPSGMGDSELRDTPQPGPDSFILPVPKPKKKKSKKEKHYEKKRPKGEGEFSGSSSREVEKEKKINGNVEQTNAKGSDPIVRESDKDDASLSHTHVTGSRKES